MTPFMSFKKCLVDAWPHGHVYICAQMVMIDYGMKNTVDNGYLDFDAIENFVKSLGMYFSHKMGVSEYLAGTYPKTSQALFDGVSKEKVYLIFMKEKPSMKRVVSNPNARHQKERIEEKRTMFIKARSLSKWHDWKTVK